ncbi:hypothetical protein [Alteribacillus bidgolensis]|uniref:Uncharacterized protein n=1 Tax=Alteribacillus bidgolensis TaxID=930129 RepID=A0A1G8NPB6_9BACI|nr:hypothetical protein [Alteribacillus bidgolensis]SDI82131.1 hypothetical protein SAMN05216352_112107 [Alteribacillus bidgolensis]
MIRKQENIPLQMECTMLFQSNPYMVENTEGLEQKLRRKKEEILPVLELLVQHGIIRKTEDKTLPLFRYKEPAVTKDLDIPSELENT